MYVIIVYDINVERVSCVYKFFLKYLYWVQNSVFEGNLREKEFAEIILYLKKHIKDKDNVLIYKISGGRVVLSVKSPIKKRKNNKIDPKLISKNFVKLIL